MLQANVELVPLAEVHVVVLRRERPRALAYRSQSRRPHFRPLDLKFLPPLMLPAVAAGLSPAAGV